MHTQNNSNNNNNNINNNNNNKFIARKKSHIKHESEVRASHQVNRLSVLIVNELGYEMRL